MKAFDLHFFITRNGQVGISATMPDGKRGPRETLMQSEGVEHLKIDMGDVEVEVRLKRKDGENGTDH